MNKSKKKNSVNDFRKKFHLDSKLNLLNISVCIDSVDMANSIVGDLLLNYDSSTNAEGLKVHTLINLVGRNYEHVEAMLVAISTGSPASAEALARVVTEGAINIMFLAGHGTPGTVVRFFESWLDEHEKKVNEWERLVKSHEYAEQVLPMVAMRKEFIGVYKGFLQSIINSTNIDLNADKIDWPKNLFRRFEILGKQTAYFTNYHRLSGASHYTAEDTLSWLFSLQMEEAHRIKMGKEAWAYSLMMVRISCTFFIDSAIACCKSLGRLNNIDLELLNKSIEKTVVDIAEAAGVPKI